MRRVPQMRPSPSEERVNPKERYIQGITYSLLHQIKAGSLDNFEGIFDRITRSKTEIINEVLKHIYEDPDLLSRRNISQFINILVPEIGVRSSTSPLPTHPRRGVPERVYHDAHHDYERRRDAQRNYHFPNPAASPLTRLVPPQQPVAQNCFPKDVCSICYENFKINEDVMYHTNSRNKDQKIHFLHIKCYNDLKNHGGSGSVCPICREVNISTFSRCTVDSISTQGGNSRYLYNGQYYILHITYWKA